MTIKKLVKDKLNDCEKRGWKYNGIINRYNESIVDVIM